MSSRLEKFVSSYCAALEVTGKKLNGIERALLIKSLEDGCAEDILEMVEIVEQCKDMELKK